MSESRIIKIKGGHRLLGYTEMQVLKHKDITEKIIGAAYDVHSFLGNGFQEVIYQRAFAWEMSQRNLNFNREIEQDIFLQKFTRTYWYTQGRFCSRRKSTSRTESHHSIRRCALGTGFKLSEGV